jgi:prepilin-type processing-associated H-X9-DG protein
MGVSADEQAVPLGSTKVNVLLLDGHGHVQWREDHRTPRTLEAGDVAIDAETLLRTLETLMIAAFRGAQPPLLSP